MLRAGNNRLVTSWRPSASRRGSEGGISYNAGNRRATDKLSNTTPTYYSVGTRSRAVTVSTTSSESNVSPVRRGVGRNKIQIGNNARGRQRDNVCVALAPGRGKPRNIVPPYNRSKRALTARKTKPDQECSVDRSEDISKKERGPTREGRFQKHGKPPRTQTPCESLALQRFLPTWTSLVAEAA